MSAYPRTLFSGRLPLFFSAAHASLSVVDPRPSRRRRTCPCDAALVVITAGGERACGRPKPCPRPGTDLARSCPGRFRGRGDRRPIVQVTPPRTRPTTERGRKRQKPMAKQLRKALRNGRPPQSNAHTRQKPRRRRHRGLALENRHGRAGQTNRTAMGEAAKRAAECMFDR